MSAEPFAFAKAAWEAGNELAAIDVRINCAGRMEPPGWVDRSITDAFSARYRGIKRGPAVSAIQYTQWQMDHLERHAAYLVAEFRDRILPEDGKPPREDDVRAMLKAMYPDYVSGNLPGHNESLEATVRRRTEQVRQADSFDADGIIARAVELLDERREFGSVAVGIEAVRKSHQRVKRDIGNGNAAAYWYPSSKELRELFRQKEGSWLSAVCLVHNGNTWDFVYLRE